LEKILSNTAGPERSRQSPKEDRVDQGHLIYGMRLLVGGATHRMADGHCLWLARRVAGGVEVHRRQWQDATTGVMFRV
jgi:hypothetical protein